MVPRSDGVNGMVSLFLKYIPVAVKFNHTRFVIILVQQSCISYLSRLTP